MARSARNGPPARHPDQCDDPLRPRRGAGTPHRPPAQAAGTAGPHGRLQRLHPAQIPQFRQPDVGDRRGIGDRRPADAGHEPHLSGQRAPHQGLLGDVRQGDDRTGAGLRRRRHRRHDQRHDENLLDGRGRRPAPLDERRGRCGASSGRQAAAPWSATRFTTNFRTGRNSPPRPEKTDGHKTQLPRKWRN